MESTSNIAAKFGERELVIARIIDAPPRLVFKAWTDPKQMAQWWGPKGFTNPVCEMDVRVGGALRIVMRSPEGNEHPMTGIFREIVEPERLVFTTVALDARGKHLLEGVATVTFEDQGGKTKLTCKSAPMVWSLRLSRCLKGWKPAGRKASSVSSNS